MMPEMIKREWSLVNHSSLECADLSALFPSQKRSQVTALQIQLHRQRLALSLFAERQQQQSNDEGQRRQRHRCSDRLIISNAGAHQKSYSSAPKTADRGGEGKRAGPAFSAILLRQPQCVHCKVCTTDAQPEQTNHEPDQCVSLQIKDIPKAERNKQRHQREVNRQRKSAAELLGENRQQQTSDDRSGGQDHRRIRRQLHTFPFSES